MRPWPFALRDGISAVVLLLASNPGCESAGDAVSHRVAIGAYAGALSVGDFDGDGWADLVVARTDASSVSILLGDGAGGFAEGKGSPFSAGHSPEDLASADFNGDGNLDVAVANHETDYVTVLLGNGRGSLVPSTASPIRVASRPHPHGVAAGDFDGDGCQDLAVESRDADAVLVNRGDCQGGFSSAEARHTVGKWPYYHLRTADLNGDGFSDVVTPNTEGSSISILLGSADGLADEIRVNTREAPFAVAIGDVSGDGHLDLAVAHRRGSMFDNNLDGITLLLGDGLGAFPPESTSWLAAGTAPTAVAIADYDGDGTADLAVANQGSDDVSLFLGGPAGTREAEGSPFAVGHLPQAVALADLNGDGRADIVAGNPGSQDLSVLLSPSR